MNVENQQAVLHDGEDELDATAPDEEALMASMGFSAFSTPTAAAGGAARGSKRRKYNPGIDKAVSASTGMGEEGGREGGRGRGGERAGARGQGSGSGSNKTAIGSGRGRYGEGVLPQRPRGVDNITTETNALAGAGHGSDDDDDDGPGYVEDRLPASVADGGVALPATEVEGIDVKKPLTINNVPRDDDDGGARDDGEKGTMPAPPHTSLPARPDIRNYDGWRMMGDENMQPPTGGPPRGERRGRFQRGENRNGVWQGDEGGYFRPSFIEDPWKKLVA